MQMPLLTTILGAALVALGVAAGQASGRPHAYIPAAFGAVFVLLGVVAHRESMRRHAMHAAAAVALLTALGTIDGLVALLRWQLGGDPPAVPMMAAAKALVSVLCIVYEGLCVRSFIAARRAS